jgi:hypothetical protein
MDVTEEDPRASAELSFSPSNDWDPASSCDSLDSSQSGKPLKACKKALAWLKSQSSTNVQKRAISKVPFTVKDKPECDMSSELYSDVLHDRMNDESHPCPTSEVLDNFASQAALDSDETKTTVMLRNVPCKYNQKDLYHEVTMLTDITFNFLYLNICRMSKRNLGYAFINFYNHADAVEFCKLLQNHIWKVYSSIKVADCMFAHVQGLEAHVTYYQKRRSGTKCRPWINVENVPNPDYDTGLQSDYKTLLDFAHELESPAETDSQ